MRRKNKSIYIVLIIVALIGITIGYAVINTTLNINGKSSISKNTWDVYFDNIVVKKDSVEAEKTPTVTDKTTVDFEVVLNLPGDFYEFTVDVVNDGSIDAMIESITKEPELTSEQQKYLNYIIEYENGEQITTKQLVSVDSFVRLKVRVEYKKDISVSDLPHTAEILNLGFNVNYVQSDGTGISVTDNGIYDPYKVGNEICIGEECFYVISSDEDSVTMLAKYNLEVGDICTSRTECTPIENLSGIQKSTMIGYPTDASYPRYGTTTFSSLQYWESTSGYVYDSNSILYNHIENYKTYLKSQGVTVEEARLIKKEELDALGCSISSRSCSSAPLWVYATSYWTGAAYGTSYLCVIYSDGYFGGNSYNYSAHFGVRPVITIPKECVGSGDEKQLIEFTIDGITYQAEEGMTWRVWVESEYDNDEFYYDQSEQEIEMNDECLGVSTGGNSNTVNPNDIIENNKSYSLAPVRC